MANLSQANLLAGPRAGAEDTCTIFQGTQRHQHPDIAAVIQVSSVICLLPSAKFEGMPKSLSSICIIATTCMQEEDELKLVTD